MRTWGYLQSINLYDADEELIKDKKHIAKTLLELCKVIDMKPFKRPFVYRFGNGALEGVSGMLFIETSSITIHCDEEENRVFVDIFSCKGFNYETALNFVRHAFLAKDYKQFILERG